MVHKLVAERIEKIEKLHNSFDFNNLKYHIRRVPVQM